MPPLDADVIFFHVPSRLVDSDVLGAVDCNSYVSTYPFAPVNVNVLPLSETVCLPTVPTDSQNNKPLVEPPTELDVTVLFNAFPFKVHESDSVQAAIFTPLMATAAGTVMVKVDGLN